MLNRRTIPAQEAVVSSHVPRERTTQIFKHAGGALHALPPRHLRGRGSRAEASAHQKTGGLRDPVVTVTVASSSNAAMLVLLLSVPGIVAVY